MANCLAAAASTFVGTRLAAKAPARARRAARAGSRPQGRARRSTSAVPLFAERASEWRGGQHAPRRGDRAGYLVQAQCLLFRLFTGDEHSIVAR